ncbi:MAG: hypothetical protein IJZ47_08000 [Oscillospiraceae bacterium]|nr:hypothetical protein [Oscillospiraceae bacterium]
MNKKKFEFSKLIIIFVGAVTILVTAFTMYMIWETKDMMAFTYLIPAVFTETASATGFYYWKARTENKIRMSKEIQKEQIEEETVNVINNISDDNMNY